MKQIVFKGRLITPMFMAGADSKTPELRPSEFKGMIRFWWKGIRAEDDIDNLRKDEAEIFGGAVEKEKRSKVILRVYPQPSGNFLGNNLKNDYKLDWRFNRNTNSLEGRDTGIGYLLYSTVLPRQEKRYIKPNFQFNLELISYHADAFKKSLASLWASIYLGGFGTRARRGGGNIVVEDADGETCGLDFIPKGNNSEEVFGWLKSNLDKSFSNINNSEPKTFTTKYTNLSFSRTIIGNQKFKDWKEALNDIGKIYAEFRKNHRLEIFDTAVFGLPVMHKNRGLIVKGVKGKGKEDISRRSSPIIFKIIKIKDKFLWYLIRLSGEFLEEGAVIKAQGTQKPDYKLIDEFWNNLREKGKEFILSQPEILKKNIEKVKTECNPDKIILFGSRARGDAHKRADIDIAVENPKKTISSLDINGPLDIVDLKNANSNLKNQIEREGVRIYERTG